MRLPDESASATLRALIKSRAAWAAARSYVPQLNPDAASQLDERSLTVLKHFAAGQSIEQIAEEMRVSEAVVRISIRAAVKAYNAVSLADLRERLGGAADLAAVVEAELASRRDALPQALTNGRSSDVPVQDRPMQSARRRRVTLADLKAAPLVPPAGAAGVVVDEGYFDPKDFVEVFAAQGNKFKLRQEGPDLVYYPGDGHLIRMEGHGTARFGMDTQDLGHVHLHGEPATLHDRAYMKTRLDAMRETEPNASPPVEVIAYPDGTFRTYGPLAPSRSLLWADLGLPDLPGTLEFRVQEDGVATVRWTTTRAEAKPVSPLLIQGLQAYALAQDARELHIEQAIGATLEGTKKAISHLPGARVSTTEHYEFASGVIDETMPNRPHMLVVSMPLGHQGKVPDDISIGLPEPMVLERIEQINRPGLPTQTFKSGATALTLEESGVTTVAGMQPDESFPQWAKGRSGTSRANGLLHWKKHGSEFPFIATLDEYMATASAIVDGSEEGVEITELASGGHIYLKRPNTLVFTNKENQILSMFVPTTRTGDPIADRKLRNILKWEPPVLTYRPSDHELAVEALSVLATKEGNYLRKPILARLFNMRQRLEIRLLDMIDIRSAKEIRKNNLDRFGHPNGPTFEFLWNQNFSSEEIYKIITSLDSYYFISPRGGVTNFPPVYWSVGREQKSPARNLLIQWKEARHSLPEFKNVYAYLLAAHELAATPPSATIHRLTKASGTTVVRDSARGLWLKIKDGRIRSMYRPKNGESDWQRLLLQQRQINVIKTPDDQQAAVTSLRALKSYLSAAVSNPKISGITALVVDLQQMITKRLQSALDLAAHIWTRNDQNTGGTRGANPITMASGSRGTDRAPATAPLLLPERRTFTLDELKNAQLSPPAGAQGIVVTEGRLDLATDLKDIIAAQGKVNFRWEGNELVMYSSQNAYTVDMEGHGPTLLGAVRNLAHVHLHKEKATRQDRAYLRQLWMEQLKDDPWAWPATDVIAYYPDGTFRTYGPLAPARSLSAADLELENLPGAVAFRIQEDGVATARLAVAEGASISVELLQGLSDYALRLEASALMVEVADGMSVTVGNDVVAYLEDASFNATEHYDFATGQDSAPLHPQPRLLTIDIPLHPYGGAPKDITASRPTPAIMEKIYQINRPDAPPVKVASDSDLNASPIFGAGAGEKRLTLGEKGLTAVAGKMPPDGSPRFDGSAQTPMGPMRVAGPTATAPLSEPKQGIANHPKAPTADEDLTGGFEFVDEADGGVSFSYEYENGIFDMANDREPQTSYITGRVNSDGLLEGEVVSIGNQETRKKGRAMVINAINALKQRRNIDVYEILAHWKLSGTLTSNTVMLDAVLQEMGVTREKASQEQLKLAAAKTWSGQLYAEYDLKPKLVLVFPDGIYALFGQAAAPMTDEPSLVGHEMAAPASHEGGRSNIINPKINYASVLDADFTPEVSSTLVDILGFRRLQSGAALQYGAGDGNYKFGAFVDSSNIFTSIFDVSHRIKSPSAANAYPGRVNHSSPEGDLVYLSNSGNGPGYVRFTPPGGDVEAVRHHFVAAALARFEREAAPVGKMHHKLNHGDRDYATFLAYRAGMSDFDAIGHTVVAKIAEKFGLSEVRSVEFDADGRSVEVVFSKREEAEPNAAIDLADEGINV